MGDLSRFRKVMRWQREALQKELASGTASGFIITLDRLVLAMMEEQLGAHPETVEGYILGEKPGMPAELAWQKDLLGFAEKRLVPQVRDPRGFEHKYREYEQRAIELMNNVRAAAQYMSHVSREVLIVRHNPVTKEIVDEIAHELLRYRERHSHDDDFLTKSAEAGLADLLLDERKDLNVALRAALSLRPDVTSIKIPEADRPTWVEAVEFAIGVIPIVGNVVAAYEAYSGRDLFGYHLSDVERGILGASVLLPIAGRMVKSGKALYTAKRMSTLYGGDAFKWSFSLAMGERMSADVAARIRMGVAEKSVRLGKPLSKQAAAEMTATLKALGIDAAQKATPSAIKLPLTVALATVIAKFPKLASLDELVIERIVAKAANFDHAKGQLMEELLEARIVGLLKDPFGRKALRLDHIKEPLEFIPGYLIRDGEGLQITDGIIVRRLEDRLDIVAVFEAKSGQASARGLGSKSTSRTKLSKDDLIELEAEARESLRELEERAKLSGTKVKTTLEELMKKIKLTEQGGQIRSDVERLSEGFLFVNAVEYEVTVGPRSTRWFGVIPKDVKGDALKRAIVDAGIPNVEIMGLDVTQDELKRAIALLGDLLKPP